MPTGALHAQGVKANPDIFLQWDESLADPADLLDPDVPATEIVDHLQAAVGQFREVSEELDE